MPGIEDLQWSHKIMNFMFRYQRLEFGYVWVTIWNSRHLQLAICVFHAASESAIRIDQFPYPGWKMKKNDLEESPFLMARVLVVCLHHIMIWVHFDLDSDLESS